jgi:hypothetical protein
LQIGSRIRKVSSFVLSIYNKREMTEEVCTLNQDKRIWELKLPPDIEFMRMFPDVVDKQEKEWHDYENE